VPELTFGFSIPIVPTKFIYLAFTSQVSRSTFELSFEQKTFFLKNSIKTFAGQYFLVAQLILSCKEI
jgi:hypothetical protein